MNSKVNFEDVNVDLKPYKKFLLKKNNSCNMAVGNLQLLKFLLFNSKAFYIKLPRK